MERLKVFANLRYRHRTGNLHSSMERLKEEYFAAGTAGYKDLHSSMERLKEAQSDGIVAGIKQFTFQYGEIKSCGTANRSDCCSSIYIPVWRD